MKGLIYTVSGLSPWGNMACHRQGDGSYGNLSRNGERAGFWKQAGDDICSDRGPNTDQTF